jgi:hypothetical protein
MNHEDKSPTANEEANMWAQLEKDPEFVKLQEKMEEEFKKLLDSDELPF